MFGIHCSAGLLTSGSGSSFQFAQVPKEPSSALLASRMGRIKPVACVQGRCGPHGSNGSAPSLFGCPWRAADLAWQGEPCRTSGETLLRGITAVERWDQGMLAGIRLL